ncbi:MAG TPA: DUF2252 domain-containing protein [Solirubrobacteraceae bacterium]|jgi:uncharacterized protein (DUF2252 family)|nr:DUF2252 domain-containing protein [Solirubrobacteraceae bacterium]
MDLDSASLGRAARRAAPRGSHAVFEPAADRSDPVELLERQARTRVPELVPIRHGRMLTSPFAFYRGAAAIMAEDLASTPRSGLLVQCCGDAHLSNFGVFGSPDRRLVFDLNDFDETLAGPWEWDLKRLAVSMLIAAQSNGFRKRDQRRVVLECVADYRRAMASFATMSNLAVWYSRFEIESLLAQYGEQLNPRGLKRTRKAVAKARTRDSMSALSKLTRVVDGELRIVDDPPLIVPIDRLARGRERGRMLAELRRILDAYRDSLPAERRPLFDQFRLADFARKVVGVGSVGTRSWIALLLGPVGDEPLFLQIKEAQPSVLEDHAGPSEFPNEGERVVVGQRLMQASSDIFLGWLRAGANGGEPRDYYGRQLKDWKASAEIDQMLPEGLAVYGRICAWTLARAHARTGDRVAIAAYLGGSDRFDQALLGFSQAYAEQNERDFRALEAAAESGRIPVETGL